MADSYEPEHWLRYIRNHYFKRRVKRARWRTTPAPHLFLRCSPNFIPLPFSLSDNGDPVAGSHNSGGAGVTRQEADEA